MKVLPCIKISSVASMRIPLPLIIVLPCITEAGLIEIEQATEALNHLSEQPVNWADSLRR